MATIKSFTDLQQSKKLAEILPIESADMHYCLENRDVATGYEIGITPYIKAKRFIGKCNIIDVQPSWNLAALLTILPPYLFEFERGIDLNVYPNINGKGWHCSYMPNCIENMETDKFKLISSEDSLVDACYEMILKLNELNLL